MDWEYRAVIDIWQLLSESQTCQAQFNNLPGRERVRIYGVFLTSLSANKLLLLYLRSRCASRGS